MNLSQSTLNSPDWFRALPLAARQIAESRTLAGDAATRQRARMRLARWSESLPFLHPDIFQRRLLRDGMTTENLEALLAEPPDSLAARLAPPKFVVRLGQAWRETGLRAPASGFVSIVRPLIDQARRRLRSWLENHEPVDFHLESVISSLERHLEARLEAQLSRTLVLEMHVARLENRLRGTSANERFESFLGSLGCRESSLGLLAEYPVLASVAVTTVDQWLNVAKELLGRWSADRAILEGSLLMGRSVGRLQAVEMSAGDFHRGGRSVAFLVLDDGRRLVYKPRAVSVDRHYRDLIAWLGQRNFPALKLRAPAVVDRGSYGWMEHVEPSPCGSEAELHRFYFRQGSLLALLWLLGATDVHHENLIAAGDHPVLIDLETLLHPRLLNSDADGTQRLLADSVLSTGLLPIRLWTSDESEGVDLSALTSRPGQLTPQPIPLWSATRTDEMRVVRQRVEIPNADNHPTLVGEVVDPLEHRHHLLDGFDAMAAALVEHREALAAPGGPLDSFADDEVRVILRPTRSYAAILRESLHPDLLRDALDRERLFDHLWVGVDARPWLEPVLDAERRALWRGDIPSFHVRAGGRDLIADDGERFPDFLDETPLIGAHRRLRKLDGVERRRQRWIVSAALSTLGKASEDTEPQVSSLHDSVGLPSQERLLAASRKIARRIAELSFRSRGRASWLGLNISDAESLSIGPMGLDFYGGLPGIILFLAYHGAIDDDRSSRNLARDGLASMADEVAGSRGTWRGVGAFSGWGGILYSCAHLFKVMGREEALALALDCLDELPDLIDGDHAHDVIGGSAGLIGGLASVLSVDSNPRWTELVGHCAEHLLAAAVEVDGGLGWPGMGDSQPLTGFAHGSAGIGWALGLAGEICDETRFRAAAAAALGHERALYSPAEKNWAKTKVVDGEASIYRVTWCHGAPGIGMSRLRRLAKAEDSETILEVEAALTTTRDFGFSRNHSLCHGDLGNLDFLLAASRQPATAHCRPALERIMAQVVAGIEHHGPLCGVPLHVETPGLMVGLAGIGYQLLRLAVPESVPSILALEAP